MTLRQSATPCRRAAGGFELYQYPQLYAHHRHTGGGQVRGRGYRPGNSGKLPIHPDGAGGNRGLTDLFPWRPQYAALYRTGPGTYTITETQPGPGWTASYIVTGSERIGGDRNEAPATGYEAVVEIEAGRTTAVTFTNHYTAPDPVPEDPDAVTLPGEALTVSKEYTGDVYDGEVSFTLTAGSYTALSDETVPEEPPTNGSAVGSDTGDPGAATDPETPVVPDDPTSPNEPTVPGRQSPAPGPRIAGTRKKRWAPPMTN